jgi:hypothetical protein
MMAPPRPRWVLPDDGIIDDLAIEIAASGRRPVPLTVPERRLAAAVILAAGGTPYLISRRLHLNSQNARTLAAELQSAAAAPPGTRAA